MFKIVIQNHSSETVINNIQSEDLDFWRELLHDAFLQGEVRVEEVTGNKHQAA